MVFGDGLFLTVGAVNQLGHVPELVFLNCCYLGQINERAERRAAIRFHELAANLATQFIRIGAKAVIAAGWAVDDGAAHTFATTFYQAMLEDHANFMDAVRRAREQTHMAHPHTNTWGAYQAYGDPAFTLDGKKSNGDSETAPWYQPYEAVLAFEEIFQKCKRSCEVIERFPATTFNELWASTPVAWQDNSDILAAKAMTAGELGLLAEAIDAYDHAIAAEQSDAPIKAIQQRANLRARYAVYLGKGKVEQDGDKPVDPLALIIASLNELETLTKLQALETPEDQPDPEDQKKKKIEQLNFLGSAAKRAAQLFEKASKTRTDIQRETASKSGETTSLPPKPDLKGWPKTQLDWLKTLRRPLPRSS